MRVKAFRVLVTAAVFAVSSLLLACPLGRLRVLIPDFTTSAVKGIQLYRVDDASGNLVGAGSIQFLGIESNATLGEVMAYRQRTEAGAPWFGPLRTPVVRDAASPNGIELELAFLNQLAAGWFKVASYNAIGTSTPSSTQVYIAADG